jgi:hypothetical protein
MPRFIITESEKNDIFKLYGLSEQTKKNPCPEGKEEDELVTYEDLKNGQVIKKGYCNSNPNSGIIKIQKKLKDLGYLKWDGLLGYYGGKTAEAISNFYKSQSCSRDVDGSALGKKTISLIEDPDRYNAYYSNEDILAATLWGEARGESNEGMKAVYTILKNRGLRNGDSSLSLKARMAGEALRPKQFSYWNDKGFGSNPRCNQGKLGVKKSELGDFLSIVNNDSTIDISGATHYVNKKRATDDNDWWNNKEKFKLVKTIDNHDFYKEI